MKIERTAYSLIVCCVSCLLFAGSCDAPAEPTTKIDETSTEMTTCPDMAKVKLKYRQSQLNGQKQKMHGMPGLFWISMLTMQ